MRYFLDSNIIIYAIKGTYPNIKKRFLEVPTMSISIPDIVMAELEYGARKSDDYKKSSDKLKIFTAPFDRFPFCGRKMAEAYGQIRSDLEKKGTPIGKNDLFIAATVLAEGGTLVTHNIKEFSRIEGLKVEDWCVE